MQKGKVPERPQSFNLEIGEEEVFFGKVKKKRGRPRKYKNTVFYSIRIEKRQYAFLVGMGKEYGNIAEYLRMLIDREMKGL